MMSRVVNNELSSMHTVKVAVRMYSVHSTKHSMYSVHTYCTIVCILCIYTMV